MPPKLSTNEGIVLDFINEQNRPLNAQNVADALQKHGIKKVSVEKILSTLGDKGQISFKEYGKQKIYLARQDQFEVPNAEELDRMRKENEQLQREINSSKTLISELEAELRSVQSNLTDKQIKLEMEKLNNEVQDTYENPLFTQDSQSRGQAKYVEKWGNLDHIRRERED
ncbi:26S proteasome regulatory subunit, ATPase 3, interacting protein [Marchantia polymorpha subsp. ruderalis]|uniref:Homologous-pairing protein 2 winged helix domain-containing protein n=1 Tax=Marchantia polymorpha TaxID=3197 RepID=A0A2R6XH19_MARPO|nr:hypothetical protein MARPO_0015s0151 [Marchantia polymorpha]PTQ45362.1 hypothetical protein MARPO_0015s0151 [Marchantia polymorpha]BBN01594.1 hypothetical protein Mp_2g08660 [Marchantia polymorpha subsp. ruderalis]BBN01595.1 hypothetical protein Mp_2g08660 [Marchantia polymorpha subsp. ruderalis]|eukprot:PTQ45359.1 hypothetical protein MARPO_0015s0151 [Marchantia polymorpha]